MTNFVEYIDGCLMLGITSNLKLFYHTGIEQSVLAVRVENLFTTSETSVNLKPEEIDALIKGLVDLKSLQTKSLEPEILLCWHVDGEVSYYLLPISGRAAAIALDNNNNFDDESFDLETLDGLLEELKPLDLGAAKMPPAQIIQITRCGYHA